MELFHWKTVSVLHLNSVGTNRMPYPAAPELCIGTPVPANFVEQFQREGPQFSNVEQR
jgi:hypothetical protein